MNHTVLQPGTFQAQARYDGERFGAPPQTLRINLQVNEARAREVPDFSLSAVDAFALVPRAVSAGVQWTVEPLTRGGPMGRDYFFAALHGFDAAAASKYGIAIGLSGPNGNFYWAQHPDQNFYP